MTEKSPASLAFLRLSVKMPLCFLGPWESLSKCHPFTRILGFPSWGFHPRWLSSEQQYRNPSPSLAVDFSPWWEGEANGTLGEPLRGVPWMMGQDTPGEEGLPQLSTCRRTPKRPHSHWESHVVQVSLSKCQETGIQTRGSRSRMSCVSPRIPGGRMGMKIE